MKTSRYTEPQILSILRQAGGVRLEASGGMPVAGLGLEHGMGRASFYKRRARDGGMDVSVIAQMKTIEV